MIRGDERSANGKAYDFRVTGQVICLYPISEEQKVSLARKFTRLREQDNDNALAEICSIVSGPSAELPVSGVIMHCSGGGEPNP